MKIKEESSESFVLRLIKEQCPFECQLTMLLKSYSED